MFALLASAVLQASSPQAWATTQGWTIGQSSAGCTASEGTTITLAATEPDGPIALDMKVPQWSGLRPLAAVEVQRADDLPRILEMEDATFDGDRLRLRLRVGEASALFRASALRLHPRQARARSLEVELPARARVLAMFQRCLTENARRDPGSGKPMATPGTTITPPTSFIRDGDYPSEALRAGVQGRTVVRLTASAAGLVSGCEVVQSSGHAALDETTCVLVSRRARFTPARDADGVATESMYSMGIVWVLAE